VLETMTMTIAPSFSSITTTLPGECAGRQHSMGWFPQEVHRARDPV